MSRDVLMSPQRIYVQFSLQREKIIKWIIGLYLSAVRNWKWYTDVRYKYVFSETFKHINLPASFLIIDVYPKYDFCNMSNSSFLSY